MHSVSRAEKLQDVLVKGLETADRLVVSDTNGQLNVLLKNASYLAMCRTSTRGVSNLRSDRLSAPQSRGARICTEHAGGASVIGGAH